ncbi:MAG: copper amine oxidase N-terminal domain-containing protein [Clostridiales Family XIII bacterium]|nr:copper amine oxidase N-terminal domain-containing protein [Clostridiales Family XIII bacterium]
MNRERLKGIFIGMAAACLICGAIATVHASIGTYQINATYSNVKIYVEGKLIDPRDANGVYVEPFIVNGTTYLPVRAVSEALGYDVEWDGDTRSVYVGKPPEYVRNAPQPDTSGDGLKEWLDEKGLELAGVFREFFGEDVKVNMAAEDSKLVLEISKSTDPGLPFEERARRETEFVQSMIGMEGDYQQMLELIRADIGRKGITMTVRHYFNDALVYMQELS